MDRNSTNGGSGWLYRLALIVQQNAVDNSLFALVQGAEPT
jgi:hypothetical protein